ncbi:hypothetical protein Trydic_g8732 [Trypoxylus dichotomus]
MFVKFSEAEFKSTSYLNASVNSENYLTITTNNFEDYEGSDHVMFSLVLNCEDDDYTLEYHVNINRTKCTSLEFTQRNFFYLFFDGLPQDYEFDLTASENVIVDCAKNPVTFGIQENEYFSIESGSQESSGSSYVTLTVKTDIQAPFEGEYNITAVDSEDPSNVATAILSIQILESNDMKFADSYYWGVIKNDLDIVISNGPITMENVMYQEDIYFEIESDYDNFFDAEFSSEGVHLFVKPDHELQEINGDSVTLVLKALDEYLENVAETIVNLNVTGEDTVNGGVEEVLTTEAPIEEDPNRGDDNQGVDDSDDDDEEEINDNSGTVNSDDELTNNNEQQSNNKDEEQQTNDKDDSQIDDNNADDKSNESQDTNNEDENQIDNNNSDGNNNDVNDPQTGDDDDDGDDVDDEEYEDDKLIVENGIVEVNVPLRGFDFWISHTRALTIMMVVISIFVIISAIIFLKSRTPYRQHYNY